MRKKKEVEQNDSRQIDSDIHPIENEELTEDQIITDIKALLDPLDGSQDGQITLPDELSLLPLRDWIIFPERYARKYSGGAIDLRPSLGRDQPRGSRRVVPDGPGEHR